MIPTRCTVKDNGCDCINPPAYVISIQSNEGEYMIGVVCLKHKSKIEYVIKENDLPLEIIKFEKLNYVGTNCISRHEVV